MGCSSSTTAKVHFGETNGGKAEVVNFDTNCLDQTAVNDLLTRDQKIIVRNTWQLMSTNVVLIGKKVFLRIFELCPHVKQLFPFRDAWGDKLITHPQFQAHAYRFMQVIVGAVNSLDELDTSYTECLANLGRSHALQRGFQHDYFDVFCTAMVFIWKQELGADFTDETEKSWTILFTYIIDTIKDGFADKSSTLDKMTDLNTYKQNLNGGIKNTT